MVLSPVESASHSPCLSISGLQDGVFEKRSGNFFAAATTRHDCNVHAALHGIFSVYKMAVSAISETCYAGMAAVCRIAGTVVFGLDLV